MGRRQEEPKGFIYLDEPEPESPPEPEPEQVEGAPDEALEDEKTEELSPVESEIRRMVGKEPPPKTEEPIPLSLATDGVHDFEWPLNGMDCPDCAMKATNATRRIPGVVHCNINPADGIVRVSVDLGQAELSKANRVLSSMGHEPDVSWLKLRGVNLDRLRERHASDQPAIRRLLLSAPGVLDVRFEEGELLIQRPPSFLPHTRIEHESTLERMTGLVPSAVPVSRRGLSTSQQRLIGASIALLVLPIVIFLNILSAPPLVVGLVGIVGTAAGGYRMFVEAFASIRNAVLGFQVLTSLAVAGAAILGYWPEALMVVLLESVSGHMESAALVRAREAMQGGLDRLPRTARVLPTDDGTPISNISSTTFSTGLTPMTSLEPGRPEPEEVPIDLVNLGEFVEVRSGELIPVDGIIVEGAGQIDRAPMTGESIPIRLQVGDKVEAGLVLLRGPVVIETTAVGEDTRLSALIDRVHTFRDEAPRLQSMVMLFTKLWVPTVIIGGAVIALLTQDVYIMLLLWVVACPCALLIAAPVPHANALANAAHHGMIARGGDVLERAARIDLALIDKTGTLTRGRPRLEGITLASGVERRRALRLAAGLEQRSNHPYAATIIGVAESEELVAMQVKSLADEVAGVSGTVGENKVCFGRDDWLTDEGINFSNKIRDAAEDARARGLGLSVLSEAGEAIALFTFDHDDLREGADALILELEDLGVTVELLSGDAQPAVELLGKRLGLAASACRGEIDPEGKAIWVRRRSQARCTLMAGDGFNDAAALAAADVGVAVGSGEQVNLEAADVLIPSDNPRMLARLIRLSRRTRMIVQVNLAISLLVTAILVISVLDGWHSSLALGVFVHEASAIAVLINSIWLADEGMSRLGMLGGLFQQLGKDMWSAWEAVREMAMPVVSRS
jgi:Cd2+/Zn2+-exporting ATPase